MSKDFAEIAHDVTACHHGEVAVTAVLAVYMGGGPAAVYGADALRAYDQFAGAKK